MERARRQSNLELLRIIAMMMIITLHFFNDHRQPVSGTTNETVYFVYESAAICGVDIFVLLTGYFSLNQDRVKIRKIFNLLLDVAFWDFIGFMLCVAAGRRSFQLKELIRSMFPIIFGGRWFVKAYILLLLLIPFLNLILCSVNRKTYRALLTILILLFSIWPSFLPNPPFDDYGYSVVHFITLYTIAGYLRLHVERFPSKILCLTGYILCFAAVYFSKLLGQGYEWAYNYPFVIGEAIFLFLFLVQFRLDSAWINRLASCAFGVYLVHTNAFFKPLGYESLFHGSSVVNGNTWVFILVVPACVAFFYLFGFALENGKKWLFAHSFNPLFDRIPLINQCVKVEGKES